MASNSLGHSTNVRRCFFEVTTVIGPSGSDKVSLAYRFTRDLRSVVLPTPGGPTMATSLGGGSSGSLSTSGTCKRFSLMSCDRAACFASRPGCAKANAFGFCSNRNELVYVLLKRK